jgi:hypothetical protein
VLLLTLLVSHHAFWFVLLEYGFAQRDAADLDFSMSDERTTIGRARGKGRRVDVELAAEILVTVYCPVMFSLTLIVPFDTKPKFLTCFWVIQKFAEVSD